jgi:glycosyltransferase involved in cell wall biosynthesis
VNAKLTSGGDSPNSERTPSVMHLLAPGGAGGLETVVRVLITEQHNRGLNVRLAAIMTAEDADVLPRSIEATNVPVHRIDAGARGYLEERRSVRRLLAQHHVDILHTHGYRPDVLDAPVARAAGIATVTTVHGFTGNSLRNRIYEQLQTRAFRRFDAVVSVSRPLTELLKRRGVPEHRLHTVRNAMVPAPDLLERGAARAALGAGPDVFVIGWVGRLSPEKAPAVFIESLASLRDFPFEACILGDGPERSRLRARVAELGIESRVRFMGVVQDAARMFRGLDLIVLSSRTEGTPMVLLEAAAAGVPIAATAVGGVPDILSSHEALLVPPDSPAALASAIRSVMTDSETASRRAVNARSRMLRDLAIEPWLESYSHIYSEVLNRRRRNPTAE